MFTFETVVAFCCGCCFSLVVWLISCWLDHRAAERAWDRIRPGQYWVRRPHSDPFEHGDQVLVTDKRSGYIQYRYQFNGDYLFHSLHWREFWFTFNREDPSDT